MTTRQKEKAKIGATCREWPLPFSRTATPHSGTHPLSESGPRSGRLPLAASTLERAEKLPLAVLRLWVSDLPPDTTTKRIRWRFWINPYTLADILAILPFCLGFLINADLRLFRILRLFRVFQISPYFHSLAAGRLEWGRIVPPNQRLARGCRHRAGAGALGWL